MIVSRFLYPHLSRAWNPYAWLLRRRFVLTEASVSPAGWPSGLRPLRVLLLSDIHTGIFLRPRILAEVVASLMESRPDLVAIAADIVTGHSSEARPFLEGRPPRARSHSCGYRARRFERGQPLSRSPRALVTRPPWRLVCPRQPRLLR